MTSTANMAIYKEFIKFLKLRGKSIYEKSRDSCDNEWNNLTIQAAAAGFQATADSYAEYLGIDKETHTLNMLSVLLGLSKEASSQRPSKNDLQQVAGYEHLQTGGMLCVDCAACPEEDPFLKPLLLSGCKSWGHKCNACGRALSDVYEGKA